MKRFPLENDSRGNPNELFSRTRILHSRWLLVFLLWQSLWQLLSFPLPESCTETFLLDSRMEETGSRDKWGLSKVRTQFLFRGLCSGFPWFSLSRVSPKYFYERESGRNIIIWFWDSWLGNRNQTISTYSFLLLCKCVNHLSWHSFIITTPSGNLSQRDTEGIWTQDNHRHQINLKPL